MSNFKYTPEMDAFIREHYLLVASELADKFNAEFGTAITPRQAGDARKTRGLVTGRTGQFYSGQPKVKGSGAKGPNKTSFKKGRMPHNSANVGGEVIDKDGYIRVKVANPDNWSYRHIINWEAVNGKMPEDHVTWFIDQDKSNCSIDNLEVIPRSEQVRRNKLQLTSQPKELQNTVKLVAKLLDKSRKAESSLNSQ